MAANDNGSNIDSILLMQVGLLGRIAFAPAALAKIVSPKSKKNDKQVKAYNLCDGTRTQAQVAKAAAVDPSNFSKAVGKWISSGVLFRLGEGKDAKLMHLYPVDKDAIAKES